MASSVSSVVRALGAAQAGDKGGAISIVVRPGDPAPSAATFDRARNAWINNPGDIAFGDAGTEVARPKIRDLTVS